MTLLRKNGTVVTYSPLLNAYKQFRKFYCKVEAYKLAWRLLLCGNGTNQTTDCIDGREAYGFNHDDDR